MQRLIFSQNAYNWFNWTNIRPDWSFYHKSSKSERPFQHTSAGAGTPRRRPESALFWAGVPHPAARLRLVASAGASALRQAAAGEGAGCILTAVLAGIRGARATPEHRCRPQALTTPSGRTGWGAGSASSECRYRAGTHVALLPAAAGTRAPSALRGSACWNSLSKQASGCRGMFRSSPSDHTAILSSLVIP